LAAKSLDVGAERASQLFLGSRSFEIGRRTPVADRTLKVVTRINL
jgi:hypothetical protein